LFREGARILMDPSAAWVEELHHASLSGAKVRAIAEDPLLAEAERRTNVANLLHWASANVLRPGERVPPALGPEALGTARDLVRRGLDADGLDSYRTTQNVVWRRWMEVCFTLTTDAVVLQELLESSSLSISTFIDDTLEALTEKMATERADLTGGTHAERRATVALLLEGAPVDRARAEARLGYRFNGEHTAAVMWGPAGIASERLAAAAESLMSACGARRRLTVVASADALWLWLPVRAPTTGQVAQAMAGHPQIRVALGRSGPDLEGFRRSHLDASVTQRMLAALRRPRQFASFQDVQLVSVLDQDPARATEFVNDTLGSLAAAEPELREFLLTYLREQSQASRTAERLYTHRNTVLRRLARAEGLLPRPLAENAVQVAAALELLAWRAGPPDATS